MCHGRSIGRDALRYGFNGFPRQVSPFEQRRFHPKRDWCNGSEKNRNISPLISGISSSGCTTYERPIKGTFFTDLQKGAAILLRGTFHVSDEITRQQRIVSERVVPSIGKKFPNRKSNLFIAPSYVHPHIKRCQNNGQI